MHISLILAPCRSLRLATGFMRFSDVVGSCPVVAHPQRGPSLPAGSRFQGSAGARSQPPRTADRAQPATLRSRHGEGRLGGAGGSASQFFYARLVSCGAIAYILYIVFIIMGQARFFFFFLLRFTHQALSKHAPAPATSLNPSPLSQFEVVVPDSSLMLHNEIFPAR